MRLENVIERVVCPHMRARDDYLNKLFIAHLCPFYGYTHGIISIAGKSYSSRTPRVLSMYPYATTSQEEEEEE